jgi:ATP-dependent DNA helicase RecG
MVHGKMKAAEKDFEMQRFVKGETNIMVATTVIEVGVDVPNATVMVIMDADRFGVSQLHQLRGRIGRGSAPGLCLLVTGAEPETPARVRLDAVAATQDGFELSRIDLEQRREGDVMGASQSGAKSKLRLLRVLRDEAMIESARDEATALIEEDPALSYESELAKALAQLESDTASEFIDRG